MEAKDIANATRYEVKTNLKKVTEKILIFNSREANEDINEMYDVLKKLENIIKTKQKEEKTKYVELVAKLDTLSPLKTLTRGYSLVEKNNNIIKSAKDVNTGDKIDLKFSDGTKQAEIL